jgi:hypothetical protein
LGGGISVAQVGVGAGATGEPGGAGAVRACDRRMVVLVVASTTATTVISATAATLHRAALRRESKGDPHPIITR